MSGLAPRALEEIVRPRRPSGVVVRPLNFTVRRPRVPALSRAIMALCETNSRQLLSATASGSSRIAPKCPVRMDRVALRQRREKASPQRSP